MSDDDSCTSKVSFSGVALGFIHVFRYMIDSMFGGTNRLPGRPIVSIYCIFSVTVHSRTSCLPA
jgi:hypothetical protein